MTDGLNGAYAIARQYFGTSSVLLPIPIREKGPKLKGWQTLTLDQSNEPAYIKRLEQSGNIGVLLGEPSGDLVDIDFDTDVAVEIFCKLNPHLADKTLQTRGSRGRHFFFRIKGEYPKRVCRLEHSGDEHVGEWRGGFGQTVVAGIHPSGIPYQILKAMPILVIKFEDIVWSSLWLKPSDIPEDVAAYFERLRKGCISAIDLAQLEIKDRQNVVGSWCKQGDLVFIFGERGSGKTWLSAGVATHAASGTDLVDWEIKQARRVLWIDGEMPLPDFRDRVIGLLDEPTEMLSLIHHEHFYTLGLGNLNLTERDAQQALTMLCVDGKIEILVLDNLSCLFSGMIENDADSWEMVLPWLLELRRMSITVFIVAHGGRNKQMRGTSKREDAAASIIKIEEVFQKEKKELEARFTSVFTKQRSGRQRETLREWLFKTDADGGIEIGCETRSFDDQVYDMIALGIDSATAIANELACAVSTVSKSAKRMLDRKLITKKGRLYSCVKLTGEK
jgi:hypothetical protein